MADEKLTKSTETETTESPRRRPYAPPTVSDFFQPLVTLGTVTTDGCATKRPPKH